MQGHELTPTFGTRTQIVGSMDLQGTRYIARIQPQEARGNTIGNIDRLVYELILKFYDSTGVCLWELVSVC